jgi:hypothetical protein
MGQSSMFTGADLEFTGVDRSRDEWETKILSVLERLPLSRLIGESGLSLRTMLDIRASRADRTSGTGNA